jgi:hypothetical protein
MKKKSRKRPGLPVLVKYVRGEKKAMKNWSRFIDTDSASMKAVRLLQKLDRYFESTETAKQISGSKTLATEIFTHYQANLSRPDKQSANLYYDSKAVPLREGFRPSLMSERRLKYAGEMGTVELSVVPVFPGHFEVTGHLEGSKQETSVRLRGRQSRRASTDEFGFFSFAAVNPGTYKLHFQSGEDKVVIHDLILR